MSIEFVNNTAIIATIASIISLFFPLIKEWLTKLISRKQTTTKITIRIKDKNDIKKTIIFEISDTEGLTETKIKKILTDAGGE